MGYESREDVGVEEIATEALALDLTDILNHDFSFKY
jgi:hypothetical protein